MDKQAKITQKELKRIEVQKRKFQLEQERVLKPGECNKYLTAVIHREILTDVYGSKIEEKLKAININVEKSSLSTPGTITWKRKFNQKIITDEGNVIEFDDVEKDEPYLVVVVGIKQFLQAMKEKNLVEKVMAAQEMCSKNPVSSTLIVYGLKAHCRRNPKATNAQETELHLTQLQMLANCSHRLFETPDEVALTVAQISRSIAEEPHKAKQNEKLDKEQLYLVNETKVNAKDDDPASLARLWHAQLNCLPKVTFDVAQSISKDYPMPRDLIEAYKKCTGNKEQMLADIKIIKTGPVAKNRRIGPELSRKICTLMTSKNPNELL
jgi:hypothetical protein